MDSRKPVDAKTLSVVAAQLADLRITPETAAAHAAILEPIMTGIDALRALPLKDAEPAVVFQPVERMKGRS
jgi:Asp-tRNA(Asn)/Glu-tRNA(Gln) amidotransferase C subunit